MGFETLTLIEPDPAFFRLPKKFNHHWYLTYACSRVTRVSFMLVIFSAQNIFHVEAHLTRKVFSDRIHLSSTCLIELQDGYSLRPDTNLSIYSKHHLEIRIASRLQHISRASSCLSNTFKKLVGVLRTQNHDQFVTMAVTWTDAIWYGQNKSKIIFVLKFRVA